MLKKFSILLIILLTVSINTNYAQITNPPDNSVVVDQVVAIVGGNIILLSDIENEYIQYLMQGNISGATELRCNILEELLFQKLLLNQAEIDSITVTDAQVDSELDRRMRYFIEQIGSKENLEQYFGKSILEIKEDLRERIHDHLLIQNIQSNITQNIRVTPAEVSKFYNSIPDDSLPIINAEYEIMQIVKKPPINEEEIALIKEKLTGLRDRIIKGDDFATLANMYSMDPGSMTKGGELGFIGRGETYAEFEAAAFSLKPGEVSPIIKTQAGYHIIQLIERRGEYINVRHILLIPQPSVSDLAKAKTELENIVSLIRMDSLSFEEAAAKYSDDPSKNNNGLIINPRTGTGNFEPDEIDPSIFFIVEKMNPGQISSPVLFKDYEDQRQAYRIILLKARTSPHKANLKDDYTKIQDMLMMVKQNEEINKWISKKSKETYIIINGDYKNCTFNFNWNITE